MFCQNCGNLISEGTRFCPYCGASVPDASQSATPVSPAPEQEALQQPQVQQAYQQPVAQPYAQPGYQPADPYVQQYAQPGYQPADPYAQQYAQPGYQPADPYAQQYAQPGYQTGNPYGQPFAADAEVNATRTLGIVALVVGLFVPLVSYICGGIGLSKIRKISMLANPQQLEKLKKNKVLCILGIVIPAAIHVAYVIIQIVAANA